MRIHGTLTRWNDDRGFGFITPVQGWHGTKVVSKMPEHRIFATPFAAVYPMYVAKAERKGRTKDEVDRVICWLTGYDEAGLRLQIEQQTDFATFFARAPALRRLLSPAGRPRTAVTDE